MFRIMGVNEKKQIVYFLKKKGSDFVINKHFIHLHDFTEKEFEDPNFSQIQCS